MTALPNPAVASSIPARHPSLAPVEARRQASYSIDDGAYRLTLDSLEDRYGDLIFTREDVATGCRRASVQADGQWQHFIIDQWLCGYCDRPLDDGACHGCETRFVEALADNGRGGVWF